MRFYVYGEGAIWRIPHAVLLVSRDWDCIMDNVRPMKIETTKSGRFRRLPSGLYQPKNDYRVGSCRKGVHVCDYDDFHDMLSDWQALLKGGAA